MTKLKLLKELRKLRYNTFDIQLDNYTFSFNLDSRLDTQLDDCTPSFSLDNNPYNSEEYTIDAMLVEVNHKNWKNSCCLNIIPFFTSCYLHDENKYLPTYIFKQVKKAFSNKKVWEQIKQTYNKAIKDNFYIEDKKDEK